MSERKRINISLTAADYARAEELAQAGGFKNVCAFSRALLVAVCRYAARRKMSAQELARQRNNGPQYTQTKNL